MKKLLLVLVLVSLALCAFTCGSGTPTPQSTYSTNLIDLGNAVTEEELYCGEVHLILDSRGGVSSNETITVVNPDVKNPFMKIQTKDVYITISIHNTGNTAIFSLFSEGCEIKVK